MLLASSTTFCLLHGAAEKRPLSGLPRPPFRLAPRSPFSSDSMSHQLEPSNHQTSAQKQALAARENWEGAASVPLRARSCELGVDGESASGGLLAYWTLLSRHKEKVFLSAVLGGLAGLLMSLPKTPIYRAETALEIQVPNGDFLNIRDVRPAAPSLGWSSADMSTQINILKSRTLIQRTVEKLKLAEEPEYVRKSGRISAWRKALGLPAPTVVSSRDQALLMAVENLTVTPAGESRIVKVRSDSTDPRLAAQVANTLADLFIRQGVEARWEATQYTEDWLGRQLEDLKIKLEKSEDKLQKYARASGLLFTSDRDNVAEEQLKQLQEGLSHARADRIAKQSRFELATTSPRGTRISTGSLGSCLVGAIPG